MSRTPLPVVWNAASGSAAQRAAISSLRDDERTRWLVPEDAAALRRTVQDLRDQGVPRIAVCGGDGTLQIALQELGDSAIELALIPSGSGNDFARAANLPLSAPEALELALHGAAKRTDLGSFEGRRFATIAGLGIDGAVLDFLDGRSGIWKGAWIYPLALLLTLARFQAPQVRVTSAQQRFEGHAMLVVVANGSQFGGGMRVAPQAQLDDGLFDIVIVRRTSKLRLLRLLRRVYDGSHTDLSEVLQFRTANVTLELQDPVRLNADGELLAKPTSAPLQLKLLAGALLFVRP